MATGNWWIFPWDRLRKARAGRPWKKGLGLNTGRPSTISRLPFLLWRWALHENRRVRLRRRKDGNRKVWSQTLSGLDLTRLGGGTASEIRLPDGGTASGARLLDGGTASCLSLLSTMSKKRSIVPAQ